jgi:hypothetical protein
MHWIPNLILYAFPSLHKAYAHGLSLIISSLFLECALSISLSLTCVVHYLMFTLSSLFACATSYLLSYFLALLSTKTPNLFLLYHTWGFIPQLLMSSAHSPSFKGPMRHSSLFLGICAHTLYIGWLTLVIGRIFAAAHTIFFSLFSLILFSSLATLSLSKDIHCTGCGLVDCGAINPLTSL